MTLLSQAHNFIDLTGNRFGRLVVLYRTDNQGEFTRWFCRCDCGIEKSVLSMHLRRGRIVSCGCWAKDKAHERATHGLNGLTLERLDTNGNYELSNCVWATRKAQANNKSNNVCFLIDDEKLTLKQISERCGVNYSALYWRIRVAGWNLSRAMRP